MTNNDLIIFYEKAKEHVIEKGYETECKYYGDLSILNVNEQIFLSEYSWVVLNSGFRESIIRKMFDFLSLCFYDWSSAEKIVSSSDECIDLAMSCFKNKSKLHGIVNGIKIYQRNGGIDWVLGVLTTDKYQELEVLPFIGPITSRHLAKNLGVPIIKPDRHLRRFENLTGFNLQAACEEVSISIGDNLRYIDSVLWRYLVLTA